MNTNKHEKLKKALDNFEKAWEELNEAWGYDNNIESDVYPFESSFDDYDITNWVNDFKAQLDNDCILYIDDQVEVDEPLETDLHQNTFVGTIINIRDEYADVEDSDGNVFTIELTRLVRQ